MKKRAPFVCNENIIWQRISGDHQWDCPSESFTPLHSKNRRIMCHLSNLEQSWTRAGPNGGPGRGGPGRAAFFRDIQRAGPGRADIFKEGGPRINNTKYE